MFSNTAVTHFDMNIACNRMIFTHNNIVSLWSIEDSAIFTKLWDMPVDPNSSIDSVALSPLGNFFGITTKALKEGLFSWQNTIKKSNTRAFLGTHDTQHKSNITFLSEKYAGIVKLENESTTLCCLNPWQLRRKETILMPGFIQNFVLSTYFGRDRYELFNGRAIPKHHCVTSILMDLNSNLARRYSCPEIDFITDTRSPITDEYDFTPYRMTKLQTHYRHNVQAISIVEDKKTEEKSRYIRWYKCAGELGNVCDHIEHISLKGAFILHKIIENPALTMQMTLDYYTHLLAETKPIEQLMPLIVSHYKHWKLIESSLIKVEKQKATIALTQYSRVPAFIMLTLINKITADPEPLSEQAHTIETPNDWVTWYYAWKSTLRSWMIDNY